MKFIFGLFVFIISISTVYGQFWVGLVGGGQFTHHVYQDKTRGDFFKVENDINFHAGLAFEYQTEGIFGIHLEMAYLQMKTQVDNLLYEKNILSNPQLTDSHSTSKHRFITAPLLVKTSFGNGPLKFFLLCGPRLSYWLGGEGVYTGSTLIEQGLTEVKYKIVYGSLDNFTQHNKDNLFIIENPNRLQYSIDLGMGFSFDFANAQRVMVNARYSFGHSIMAFNHGADFSGTGISEEVYLEDMEYRNPQLFLSLAYMIGYNPQLQRRGKSSMGKR